MLVPNIEYYIEIKTGPKTIDVVIAKYNGKNFIQEVSSFMGKEKVYRADEVVVYFPVDRDEYNRAVAKNG